MSNKVKYVLVAAVLLFVFQGAPAKAALHALGTNIITPQGTVYTITSENNQTVKRAYTSAGAFLSYSYNTWESVTGASTEDLALPTGSLIPPQDGKIICSDRGSDKGTCYLITNSKKAGFVNSDIFAKQGYNFKYAMSGDVSFLPSTSNIDKSEASHQTGSLINKDGTVYLVAKNGLLGLPSWDTLKSWGYVQSDIVPANSADRNLSVIGNVTPKQPEQISPPDSNDNPPTGSVYTLSKPYIEGSTNVIAGTSNLYQVIASATYGTTGSGVTLNNTRGYYITYTYDWGDGSEKASKAIENGYSIYHVWNNPGTYKVTVVAADSFGKSTTNSIYVTVSQSASAADASLILSDTFATFNYDKGSTLPQPATRAITTHVSNSSSTQNISFSISVPNQPAWLNTSYTTSLITLGPLQSSGVGVSVDGMSLPVGTYITTIYFIGNFANSPANIGVTVKVIDSSITTPTFVVTDTLPDAVIGQSYSYQLQGTGTAPYKWDIISTSYPSGCCILGINEAGLFNTQTAFTIQGPAGTYYWTLIVTDATGTRTTRTLRLNIKNSSNQPTITVLTPNGSENWASGSTQIIQWTMPSDKAYAVRLYLMPQGSTPVKSSPPAPGTSDVMIDPIVGGYDIGGQVLNYAASQGSYNWVIGTWYPVGTYKIRAQLLSYFDSREVLAKDDSDTSFNIISNPSACSAINQTVPLATTNSIGSVNITSPNGGECLTKGSNKKITWTNSSNIDSVMIGYSFGIGSLNLITNSPVPNTGSYDWNVNVGNTANAQVKIQITGYQTGSGSVTDLSDNFFTVY